MNSDGSFTRHDFDLNMSPGPEQLSSYNTGSGSSVLPLGGQEGSGDYLNVSRMQDGSYVDPWVGQIYHSGHTRGFQANQESKYLQGAPHLPLQPITKRERQEQTAHQDTPRYHLNHRFSHGSSSHHGASTQGLSLSHDSSSFVRYNSPCSVQNQNEAFADVSRASIPGDTGGSHLYSQSYIDHQMRQPAFPSPMIPPQLSLPPPERNIPDTLLPPWEYQYRPQPYRHRTQSDLAWPNLQPDQRIFVLSLFHAVRPYTFNFLKEHLPIVLGRRTVEALFSNNQTTIDQAIEGVIKLDTSDSHLTFTPWMANLDNRQRVEVIRRLAWATSQNEDRLRDHMIKRKTKPQVGQVVLNAMSPQAVEYLAYRYNLLNVNERANTLPWEIGASQLQLIAIKQRLGKKRYSSFHNCVDRLNLPHVPDRFGLKVLRAGDQEFYDLMVGLVDGNLQSAMSHPA